MDRKRLELARALATQPILLLLDELLAGLNPTEVREAMDLIRELRATGLTVVMVEHVVKAIFGISDRVVVMSNRPGRIAEIMPIDMSHPRDVGSPEYGRLKNRLYELLGVPHSV